MCVMPGVASGGGYKNIVMLYAHVEMYTSDARGLNARAFSTLASECISLFLAIISWNGACSAAIPLNLCCQMKYSKEKLEDCLSRANYPTASPPLRGNILFGPSAGTRANLLLLSGCNDHGNDGADGAVQCNRRGSNVDEPRWVGRRRSVRRRLVRDMLPTVCR